MEDHSGFVFEHCVRPTFPSEQPPCSLVVEAMEGTKLGNPGRPVASTFSPEGIIGFSSCCSFGRDCNIGMFSVYDVG